MENSEWIVYLYIGINNKEEVGKNYFVPLSFIDFRLVPAQKQAQSRRSNVQKELRLGPTHCIFLTPESRKR